MATQVKRGYLRGCRGILVTELGADGSIPEVPERLWVNTSQEASIEAEIVEGETTDLRGGDRLLVQVQENDIVLGMNIDFTDARFDAELLELIMGGTLITTGAPPDEEVIGWEGPKVEEQTDDIPFQAELFVQSFNAEGGREAYLKYKFPYCTATMGGIDHSDQEWGTPSFSLRARENPSTGASAHRREFTEGMPHAVNVETEGGTVTVVTDPNAYALGAETVTVYISDIEGGKTFDSITVTDADGDPVDTTEVQSGEEYTFIMPHKSVTVLVAID